MPNKLKKSLLVSLLILITIAVILYISAIKIFIPNIVRKSVNTLASEKGLNLTLKQVRVSPVFSILIDKVSLSNESERISPIISIENVAIKLNFLSSITDRTLSIEKIVLKQFHLYVERIDNELWEKLFKQKNLYENKATKKPSVKLHLLVLENSTIQFNNKDSFLLENLKLKFNQSSLADTGQSELNVDFEIDDNIFSVTSVISKTEKNKSLALLIICDNLHLKKLDNYLVPKLDLSLESKININLQDDYSSSGIIELIDKNTVNANSSNSLARLSIKTSYNRDNNSINLTTFNLFIENLLEASLRGKLTDLKGDRNIDLKGNAKLYNLIKIQEHYVDLSNKTLDGNLAIPDLNVSGSYKQNDLKAYGKLKIESINFKSPESNINISDLNGLIEFELFFSRLIPKELKANGSIYSKIISTDFGMFDNIKSRINFNTNNNWTNNILTFENLFANYLNGSIKADLKLNLSKDKKNIKGILTGNNIEVDSIIKKITPIDIKGILKNFQAEVNSNFRDIEAKVKIVANQFSINIGNNKPLKISRITSTEPFIFFYNTSFEKSEEKLTISTSGCIYEDLNFDFIKIKSGMLEDWKLDLGSDDQLKISLRINGKDAVLFDHVLPIKYIEGEFEFSIGEISRYSGSINGKDILYQDFNFPSISANLNFSNNHIEFTNVKAEVNKYGLFESEKINTAISKDILVDIDNGKFTFSDYRIISEGISSRLKFITDKKELAWGGNVYVDTTSYKNHQLKDLKLSIGSKSNTFTIDNVSGNLLNGTLIGSFRLEGNENTDKIRANIEITGPSLEIKDFLLLWDKLKLNYEGEIANSKLGGKGSVNISSLTISKDNKKLELIGEMPFSINEGDLKIINANVQNNGISAFFDLYCSNCFDFNNGSSFTFISKELSTNFVTNIVKPFLPAEVMDISQKGNMNLVFGATNQHLSGERFQGLITFNNIDLSCNFYGTQMFINGVNGSVRLKDKAESINPLKSILGSELKLDNEIYKKFYNYLTQADQYENLDLIKINEFKYGIFDLENIEIQLELIPEELTIKRFGSEIFKGELMGTGYFKFSNEQEEYNLSLLLKDISLMSISEKVKSIEDYITGKINGLAWFSATNNLKQSLHGPFKFWSVKSQSESRKIGRALLSELGAKERLFLRKSRTYDRAEISGYIKDGVLTFNEFEITNDILGYRNLDIKVDKQKNSITVDHLLSVIDEIGKRTDEIRIESN